MREFTYHEPRTLEEASQLLQQLGTSAAPLAGGTDLLVKMKNRGAAFEHIVNIKRVPGLRGISATPEGYRVGALSTIAHIAQHPDLQRDLPAISRSAAMLGSSKIRNLATLGGNLCNAAPSADMSPALLALNARAIVDGVRGPRQVPLESFFLGPGKVDLAPGELMIGCDIPLPPPDTRTDYLAHTPRKAMDLAVVGIAAALTVDPGENRIERARIALGAVAPTPVRAVHTEALLSGAMIRDVDPEKIAQEVKSEASPITDIRASSEYRFDLLSVLTARIVRSLLGTG